MENTAHEYTTYRTSSVENLLSVSRAMCMSFEKRASISLWSGNLTNATIICELYSKMNTKEYLELQPPPQYCTFCQQKSVSLFSRESSKALKHVEFGHRNYSEVTQVFFVDGLSTSLVGLNIFLYRLRSVFASFFNMF